MFNHSIVAALMLTAMFSQPSFAQDDEEGLFDLFKKDAGAAASTVGTALDGWFSSGDDPDNTNKGGEVVQDGMRGAAICGSIFSVFGAEASTVSYAAAACGVANAGVTALAQEGRKDYAEKYEQINKDMAEAEGEIAALESATDSNYAKVDDYDAEVEQLIADEKDNRKFIKKAAVLREELDDQMRANRRARSLAEAKLSVLEEDVAALDEMIAEFPDMEELKQTRTALIDQKGRLIESIQQSNGMNDQLASGKNKLDEQTIERS